MTRTAVLLMDLQIDFLNTITGRMPVGDDGANRVLAAARAALLGEAYPGSIVVGVVNAFQPNQFIGNFVRRNAALIGSPGAALDPRLPVTPELPIFPKSAASAFSNPELHKFLQSEGVSTVVLIGVFAEGCVRATALAAKLLGYTVVAPLNAIATNSPWKLAFAVRSMRRHGVLLPNALLGAESAT